MSRRTGTAQGYMRVQGGFQPQFQRRASQKYQGSIQDNKSDHNISDNAGCHERCYAVDNHEDQAPEGPGKVISGKKSKRQISIAKKLQWKAHHLNGSSFGVLRRLQLVLSATVFCALEAALYSIMSILLTHHVHNIYAKRAAYAVKFLRNELKEQRL